MITIPRSEREAFQSSAPKNLTLNFPYRDPITNENIYMESAQLEQSICEENNLTFGMVYSSRFSVRIFDNGESYIGVRVNPRLSVTVDDRTFERSLGNYTVKSDKLTSDKLYRDLDCYDYLEDVLPVDFHEWHNNRPNTFTLKQYRDAFFSYIGLEQVPITLPNDNVTLNKFNVTEFSGADILSCILQLSGAFGFIAIDGRFKYVIPKTSSDYLIDDGSYVQGSFNYEDESMEPITQVIIKGFSDDYGEEGSYSVADASMGDATGNVFTIENNNLIQSCPLATRQLLCSNLYYAIINYSYYPSSVDLPAYIGLEPGDVFTIETDRKTVTFPVFKRTLKGISALKDSVEAPGEVNLTANVNMVGTGVSSVQRALDQVRESVAELLAQKASIAAQDAAIAANIAANGALTQLSIVQDVAGTLNWIREHGTFVLTEDTVIDPNTVYFVYENGEYTPIVSPDPNLNPSEEGWYVLDVTSSQSDYIMAHLAVTEAGLWVLPFNTLAPHPLVDSDDNDLIDSNNNHLVDWSRDPQYSTGYKVLLSNTGMTVYDSFGVAIANYGETITIGSQLYYNAFIDSQGMKIRHGNKNLASYGSTTKFYEPDGETEAVEIGSDGIVIKEGIIKLGNKTSASDMTNSGTYIDTDGNMATSDIKAHGGTIGGFSINETQLNAYSSNGLYRVVANSNPGTNGGDVAFGVASRASASAAWTWNAYMTHAGYFRATNANIAGIINSTSGNIGGWGIYPTGLYYPDNSSSSLARITSSVVKVGDSSLGYVMIGAVGNTAGTWGIQSSDDYNFSIENGITNIVFGKDSAVVRPVVGGDVSLGTNGHRFLDVWCTRGAFNGSDLKEKLVIDDFDWKVDEFIQGLRPIAFKRTWENGSKSERIELGFGAQDVAKLSKDLDIGDLHLYNATIIEEDENGEKIEKPYHGEEIDDSKLSWSLAYTELIAPMVLEIQRLMKRVDELESKIEEMGG